MRRGCGRVDMGEASREKTDPASDVRHAGSWVEVLEFLRFLAGQLPGVRSDESIVELRQRVEGRRLGDEFLRLLFIALALVSLTETIQVAGILQVGLLKLRSRLCVVFFRQRDRAVKLMRLLELRRVLRGSCAL